MATFKVLLKRIAYAEVVVEADSAAEAKRLVLADDDTSFDYFTGSGNTWYGPEIKVDKVRRADEVTT